MKFFLTILLLISCYISSAQLDIRIATEKPISRERTVVSIKVEKDGALVHEGKASIKIRGSSSANYPKKGYALEFQKEDGSNDNVAISGMPAEDDWVLHGPYSDKTLMRNALAYHIARQVEPWAPRTRFCELWIDTSYRGVYLLVEKIKIHESRVDISQEKGFIISIDRPEEPDHGWWSHYTNDAHWFEYKDPDEKDITSAEREYIKSYIRNFEDALSGPNYADPYIGYRKWVDEGSLVDHLILRELTNDVDAYRLSTYMYKDLPGRLHLGPLWDANFSFGNLNHCFVNLSTNRWAYNADDSCGFEHPFWWDRLLTDTAFLNLWQCRWQELRGGPLSDEKINHLIDSFKLVLQEPQVRNFERWDVIGVYVAPNPTLFSSWNHAVEWMRDWIMRRLTWLDAKTPGTCREAISPPENIIQVGPIPFSSYINFFGLPVSGGELQLFNSNGQLQRQLSVAPNTSRFFVDDLAQESTLFYWRFVSNDGEVSRGVIVSDKW